VLNFSLSELGIGFFSIDKYLRIQDQKTGLKCSFNFRQKSIRMSKKIRLLFAMIIIVF